MAGREKGSEKQNDAGTEKLKERIRKLEHKLAEQQKDIKLLEESQAMMSLLMENSSDAFFILDPVSYFCRYASPACQELLGYDARSIIGEPVNMYIHPEDQLPILKAVNSIEIGQRNEVQCRFLRIDGSYACLGIKSRLVDFQGRPVLVVLARDISDVLAHERTIMNKNEQLKIAHDNLKFANERLKLSEGNLELAMWASGQGMWDWDVTTGQIIFNRHMNDMLGWFDKPMVTTLAEWMKLIHTDDRNRVIQEFNQYIQTRSELFEVQYRIRRADRRYVWVVDRGRVVKWNEEGLGIRAVGMRQDISREKEMERELIDSRNRYLTLLDTVPEIIVQLEADGRLIWLNDQGREFFGNISVGKKLQDMTVGDATREEFNELLGRLYFHPGDTLVTEAIHFRRDGQARTLRWQCKVLKKQDGGQGILASARDVTEMRRNEEKVLYMSFHDRLTGVYNRAFLEEEMSRLDVERQLPISIIVGDVNALKLTNDTFGHFEGDRLLVNLAEILRGNCRDEDIIARWGGDEFVILLPRTRQEEAEAISQRIKQACHAHPVDPIQPSLAMGVATKNTMLDNIYGIISEAENRMYHNKRQESPEYRQSIIESLEYRLYKDNQENPEHVSRIKLLAQRFGQRLGLPSADMERLKMLARLHDIGNISIDSNILNKQGPLNGEEWSLIRKHPETGMRIAQSSNDLAFLSEDIYHHHEHWDGHGYPIGLKGEDIPLKSRIFAIIDAYDAMTNNRSYRRPYSHDEALAEIKRCAGTHFDPGLVRQFINIFD